MTRAAVGGLVTALIVAGAITARAYGATRVSVPTTDGLTLVATVFEPAVRPAAAVLLVHMQGRTRHDWDEVGSMLAARGLVALSVDLRNHGESSAAPAAPDDSTTWQLDLVAALAWLEGHAELVNGRVAIAGASVGANLAVLAAADMPQVAALVLLSPGLEYRGVRIEQAWRKYSGRPALIVASQEDPYASRSARTLATSGAGIRDVRVLDGAGHGTVMLSRARDLAAALVDWLAARLL